MSAKTSAGQSSTAGSNGNGSSSNASSFVGATSGSNSAPTDKPKTTSGEIINGFHVPKWASKPPSGLHLDVMKEGKMIQKLMIDEKKCYFFGRNKDTCDFVIDHASCSRVHAVLVWHKDLNRSFIVDLNSTHGTFIGSLRLEPNKPQQVFVDSELKFGASTRSYIVRERPQINKNNTSSILNSSTGSATSDNGDGAGNKDDSFTILATNLPESELELDNLTEFNTAHNKRIAQLVEITSSNSNMPPLAAMAKPKRKSVTFNDEEDIINPEDIDSSIGRFRNLVQTTIVIPNKKKKIYPNEFERMEMMKRPKLTHLNIDEEEDEDHAKLYDDDYESSALRFPYLASNLGIKMPDLAPNVDTLDEKDKNTSKANVLQFKPKTLPAVSHSQDQQQIQHQQQQQHVHAELISEFDHLPHGETKKKYAKEAWPGRHPSSSSLHSINKQAGTSSNSSSSYYDANEFI